MSQPVEPSRCLSTGMDTAHEHGHSVQICCLELAGRHEAVHGVIVQQSCVIPSLELRQSDGDITACCTPANTSFSVNCKMNLAHSQGAGCRPGSKARKQREAARSCGSSWCRRSTAAGGMRRWPRSCERGWRTASRPRTGGRDGMQKLMPGSSVP